MKDYVVSWEELVFDQFDELEAINPRQDFNVRARSFKEAKLLAGVEAISRVGVERPNQGLGSFIPSILTITDPDGVVKEVNPPRSIG